MAAELVVWHESSRISHEEAAAKYANPKTLPETPAILAFREEIARELPQVDLKGDKKRHAVVLIPEALRRKAVPRVRYVAAKHRLVCYDPRWEAVLNPPLLRRPDTFELTPPGDFAIEGPTEAHIRRAVQTITAESWFVVLDNDDSQYVQGAYGPRFGFAEGSFVIESREGEAETHVQAEASGVDELVAALVEHASGSSAWRDRFKWRAVEL